MTDAVLLLNADGSPIKVIAWERAVYLLLDNKAYMAADYVGRVIRSAHAEMARPAVVILKTFVKATHKVRFNRANVFARDSYECLYCGIRPRTNNNTPRLEDLTWDHVVPRAQSRGGKVTLPWNGRVVAVTCWENVVSACFACNAKKADRTPAQAGLKLKVLPHKPSPWDSIMMAVTRHKIPQEWIDFLPKNSPWRDFWEEELSPD